mmetsp:Transcript_69642/g.197339  ORF Transcript_69642/g.197339 Transcript_69642/m.197339 type:complete len:293 (-) Transcript_69642:141-1019(-)
MSAFAMVGGSPSQPLRAGAAGGMLMGSAQAFLSGAFLQRAKVSDPKAALADALFRRTGPEAIHGAIEVAFAGSFANGMHGQAPQDSFFSTSDPCPLGAVAASGLAPVRPEVSWGTRAPMPKDAASRAPCRPPGLWTTGAQPAPQPAIPVKTTGRRRGKPRKQDLVQEFINHDGPITTLMLCNIPCCITQDQLMDAVNGLGFGGKYDLLVLPSGGRSPTSGSANRGYGFVNFSHPEEARQFVEAFSGYYFRGARSTKICSVRPAHVQGFERTVEHLRRSCSRRCTHSSFVCPL